MSSTLNKQSVVIAGGGPTGMTLAAELTLAGVDVVIVERRANQNLAGARAGGLHSRTIELFDQRGIADRFVSRGQPHRFGFSFNHTPVDISDLPSRHNYFLGIWQQDIEKILADWIEELGVPVHRDNAVVGFEQSDSGVSIHLIDGTTLEAEYLVGCDGGRSIVRKAAAIDFEGWDPTKSWLIAEAKVTEEPAWGFREDSVGTHAIGKLEDPMSMRVVLTEQQLKLGGEPTLSDVSDALVSVYGTDFGIHNPISISRFTDVTRQATLYRKGRVLLAGDSAHVHPPMGGQGLNIGVQDAMNLGWKLALVVKGLSPANLLDTYQTERHPIAARVLRNTMAHVALQRTDERTKALGETLSTLLKMDVVRKAFAAEMSGLDTHYECGEGHPLLGRRMPDIEVHTAKGPLRMFTLLHQGQPVLLNLGERGRFDNTGWTNRVRTIEGKYEGEWDLPVIGSVAGPSALLIRPDGYVAWAEDGAGSSFIEALIAWFGPPAAS